MEPPSALLTVLLTFHHARITREQSSTLERRAQIRIKFEEGSGDPQTHRTGLSRQTAPVSANEDIDFPFGHSRSSMPPRHESAIGSSGNSRPSSFVHKNLALSSTDPNPCHSGLSSSGTPVVRHRNIPSPSPPLRVHCLGLLRRVGMSRPTVNLEFPKHAAAEHALGKHAFDDPFEEAFPAAS